MATLRLLDFLKLGKNSSEIKEDLSEKSFGIMTIRFKNMTLQRMKIIATPMISINKIPKCNPTVYRKIMVTPLLTPLFTRLTRA